MLDKIAKVQAAVFKVRSGEDAMTAVHPLGITVVMAPLQTLPENEHLTACGISFHCAPSHAVTRS